MLSSCVADSRCSGEVKKGDPIFTLDDSKQRAAVESARRQVVEVDAAMFMAQADIAAADGQILKAKGEYEQALEELQMKEELVRRNADVVARREIERLQNVVEARQGSRNAADASRQAAVTKLSTLLPAQKASAEAALAQAQVELDKTVVRAGTDGRVEQFALKVGDVVTPMARSAGVLIPEGQGSRTLYAGFGQIEGQVLKVGMVAEATCISKPWTIIPVIVTQVQNYVAAGQFRGGEQLVEVGQVTKPGAILAVLEPLYEGGLDGVTPGSSCIANAYTSHHELLVSGQEIGSVRRVALHVVDGVGLVHAMILRIQALLMPFQDLVFSGH